MATEQAVSDTEAAELAEWMADEQALKDKLVEAACAYVAGCKREVSGMAAIPDSQPRKFVCVGTLQQIRDLLDDALLE